MEMRHKLKAAEGTGLKCGLELYRRLELESQPELGIVMELTLKQEPETTAVSVSRRELETAVTVAVRHDLKMAAKPALN